MTHPNPGEHAASSPPTPTEADQHTEEESKEADWGTASEPQPEPSLEERLARIEEIVRALDTDSPGLDEAMALFEEGTSHLKVAHETLSQAELKVEELIGPSGKERHTIPLPDEGDDV